MKKIFLFAALAWLPLFARAGFVSRFPQLPSKKKPIAFQIQNEFYHSAGNYRPIKNSWSWIFFGEYEDLKDSNDLRYLKITPSVSYSPFSWLILEAFAGLIWVSSKTGETVRDILQPSAAGGGFVIYKRIKSSYLGFEFRGGVPLMSVPQNTNDAVGGDGAYFAEPGAWLIYRPRSRLFYLFNNTRFRYRTEGLSSLLLSSAGGVLKTDLTDIGISADIFLPVLLDTYSRQPNQRWSITDRVNGGSYKFYSVDPRAVSVSVWTNWSFFKPVRLTFYGNFDLTGQNYARGLTLGAIASLRLNTKAGQARRAREGLKALDLEYSGEYVDDESGKKAETEYFEEEDDPQSPDLNKEMKNEIRRLR